MSESIEAATLRMLPETDKRSRLPVKKNSASALEIGTAYKDESGGYVIRRGENIHFRMSPTGYPWEVIESKYKDIESLMADGWLID